MIREVYIKIKGRVQGIGFRNWAVKRANQIGGVSGWVRNTELGTVEVFMCGEEAQIDEMLVACHKGPMLARVDNVEFVTGRLSGLLPPIKEGTFERI